MTKDDVVPTAPSLSLEDFLDLIKRVAEQQSCPSIIDGIEKKGSAYSLREDSELDSLDTVEVIMEVEGRLGQRPGFEGLEINDELLEQAKNVGDLHRLICEKRGIKP